MRVSQVLLHARVPVIKAEAKLLKPHSNSNGASASDWIFISVDISVDSPAHSGIATTEMVRTMCQAFPALAPTATIIKTFLRSKVQYHFLLL